MPNWMVWWTSRADGEWWTGDYPHRQLGDLGVSRHRLNVTLNDSKSAPIGVGSLDYPSLKIGLKKSHKHVSAGVVCSTLLKSVLFDTDIAEIDFYW